PGPRYEVGECSSTPAARSTGGFRADYGFVGTLDANPDREIELGQRMIDFITIVRQDTYEIYGRLDDAHDDRSLMSGTARRGTDSAEDIADSDGSTTESAETC
ncbi:hypothetical protein Tco_1495867, partial [Tanacetum coccineum]